MPDIIQQPSPEDVHMFRMPVQPQFNELSLVEPDEVSDAAEAIANENYVAFLSNDPESIAVESAMPLTPIREGDGQLEAAATDTPEGRPHHLVDTGREFTYPNDQTAVLNAASEQVAHVIANSPDMLAQRERAAHDAEALRVADGLSERVMSVREDTLKRESYGLAA